MPTRGDSVAPVYRYCAVVGDLMRWTQYLVSVRAWAGAEISIASTSVKASTMSDCEYRFYLFVMMVNYLYRYGGRIISGLLMIFTTSR